MSSIATLSTTSLDQIELVNIVSVSEFRLQKNFQMLMKCLQDHASKLDSMEQIINLQNSTISDLTGRVQAHESDSASQFGVYGLNSEKLQKKVDDLSNKIQQNSLETKTSIAAIQDEIRIMNCLGDDRTATFQQQMRDTERHLQSVQAATGKIDLETEKFRKESGVISVKADTAFKKAKLVEERVVRIDEKVAKVQAESVLLKQTLCNSLGSVGFDPLEISDNFGQFPEEQKQGEKRIGPTTERRKRFAILQSEGLGYQGARTFQQLKKRIQALETLSKDATTLAMEKVTTELNQIKSLKADLKKEIHKQKSENSMSVISEKIDQFRPQLNNLTGRIDITEDKSFALERKMEQVRRNIIEMTSTIKQINTSKYDQKIRLLQSDLLTQIKEVVNQLDLKVDTCDFSKQKQNTEQKLKQINEILGIKCDKVEVKKALLFIESKIKQIILVISEDEENEREALLTKKNLKCISCDKELDKFAGLVSVEAKNWNLMPAKELHTDSLGKFGITKYGSLAKKLRKLESNDLPILRGGRKTTE